MAKQKKNPTALLDQHNQGLTRSLRLSAGLGIIQTLCTLGFAYVVAGMIDQVLMQGALNASIGVMVLTVVGILAIKAGATLWQTTINLRNSVVIRDRLRQQILDYCFKTGIRLFPDFKPSQLANLLTSEVDKLKEYYADFKVQKQMSVWTPVLILIAASFVNWLVPLILLLTTPLIPIFMMLIGNKAAAASRDNLNELNRLGHLLEDRLRNVDLLQQQGAVDSETSALYQQSNRFRVSTMKVLRLAFLSGTLLEFFAAISVALVAVYLGLFFLDKYSLGAWDAQLTFAQGAFLLMLAPEYYLPLRKLGALYHAKSNARAVAEHIQHLKELSERETSDHQSTSMQRLHDTLTLTQFSGGNDSPVHLPIDITLKRGEALLIDAPSGTGKTTLLDTLAGLRKPASGQLMIDGQPVDPFDNPDWQMDVGYITQHPELIYGTLKENLSLGRSFTDDEIWAALETAQLSDVVNQLPSKLDYFITDAGHFLSGGQVQRLAIARVLLHRPALLLLDEPIANLDVDTAQQFMSALAHHTANGGLLIMASHRTSHFVFDHHLTLEKAGSHHE